MLQIYGTVGLEEKRVNCKKIQKEKKSQIQELNPSEYDFSTKQ